MTLGFVTLPFFLLSLLTLGLSLLRQSLPGRNSKPNTTCQEALCLFIILSYLPPNSTSDFWGHPDLLQPAPWHRPSHELLSYHEIKISPFPV